MAKRAFGTLAIVTGIYAQVLSRALGKDVRYKQLTLKELLQQRASSQSPAPGQVNARTGYGESEQLQRGELKESFLLQHIREVALDYQAGIFADTNDEIETIGGPPAHVAGGFHREAPQDLRVRATRRSG